MRCARTKTDSVAGAGACAIAATALPTMATHVAIEIVEILSRYTALHLIGVSRLSLRRRATGRTTEREHKRRNDLLVR